MEKSKQTKIRLLDFFKQPPRESQIRLSDLEQMIAYNKTNREKYVKAPKFSRCDNLLGVTQPFYFRRGDKIKHSHAECDHECLACKMEKIQTKICFSKLKSQRHQKQNKNFLTYRQPKLYKAPQKTQKLPQILTNTKSSELLQAQREEDLEQIKNKIRNTVQAKLDSFIQKFRQSIKIGESNLKIKSTDIDFLKFRQKARQIFIDHFTKINKVQKIFKKHRDFSKLKTIGSGEDIGRLKYPMINRKNTNDLNNSINLQQLFLDNLGIKNQLIQAANCSKKQTKQKKKFKKKSKPETKKKPRKVQRLYTKQFLQGQEEQQEFSRVVSELIKLKDQSFQLHLSSIKKSIEAKFVEIQNSEQSTQNYQKFHNLMNFKVQIMSKAIDQQLTIKSQWKRKKNIMQKTVKKTINRYGKTKAANDLLYPSYNEQQENNSNQSGKSRGLQKSLSKSRRSNLSRKAKSGLFGEDFPDQENSLNSSNDSLEDITSMDGIKSKMMDKKLESQKVISDRSIARSRRNSSSMKSIAEDLNLDGQIFQFKNQRNKSGRSSYQSNRASLSSSHQGQKLRKKTNKIVQGQQTIANKTNTHKTIQRSPKFGNASKFKEIQESSKQLNDQKKKKNRTNQEAKQNLKKFTNIIQKAEKWLKATSLMELIINQHNTIFVKKKKMREIHAIINKKYAANEISREVMEQILKYLQVIDQNCKLVLSGTQTKELRDYIEDKDMNYNLIQPSDLHKQLKFYDLSKEFFIQEYEQVEYKFKFQDNEQQENKGVQLIAETDEKQAQNIKDDLQILGQKSVDDRFLFQDNNIQVQSQKTLQDHNSQLDKMNMKLFNKNSAFFKVKNIMKELKNKKNLTQLV